MGVEGLLPKQDDQLDAAIKLGKCKWVLAEQDAHTEIAACVKAVRST